jgi:hypothetical protein
MALTLSRRPVACSTEESHMLDITTLAAWGEFIGGIAVVVSLVYLAGQIRQNSRLLRASGGTAAAQSIQGFSTTVAQDEDVARLYWDGLRDRATLSESDRRRFDMLLAIFASSIQQQLSLARDGLMDTDIWDSQVRSYRWVLGHSGALQWWDEYRGNSADKFCDFVDGLIREGEAAE